MTQTLVWQKLTATHQNPCSLLLYAQLDPFPVFLAMDMASWLSSNHWTVSRGEMHHFPRWPIRNFQAHPSLVISSLLDYWDSDGPKVNLCPTCWWYQGSFSLDLWRILINSVFPQTRTLSIDYFLKEQEINFCCVQLLKFWDLFVITASIILTNEVKVAEATTTKQIEHSFTYNHHVSLSFLKNNFQTVE